MDVIYLDDDSDNDDIIEYDAFEEELENPTLPNVYTGAPKLRNILIRHPEFRHIFIWFEEFRDDDNLVRWRRDQSVEEILSPFLSDMRQLYVNWVLRNNVLELLPPEPWTTAAETGRFYLADTVLKHNLPTSSQIEDFKFDIYKIFTSGKGYRKSKVYECATGRGYIASRFPIQVSNWNAIRVESNPGQDQSGSIVFMSRGRQHVTVTIDLNQWGVQDWVMDYARPTIRVTQQMRCDPEHSGNLTLAGELTAFRRQMRFFDKVHDGRFNQLTSSKKRFKVVSRYTAENDWTDHQLEFSNYAHGMRYMTITTKVAVTEGRPIPRPTDNGLRIGDLWMEVIMPEHAVLRPKKQDRDLCRFDDMDYETKSPTEKEIAKYVDVYMHQDFLR